MAIRTLTAAVPALGLLACGGDGDLSCELLADETNCWAAGAKELSACIPAGEVGTLAADRTLCTFSDGTTIRFDPPWPTNLDDVRDLARLHWEVEAPGGVCGAFVDTLQNRMELTSGSNTYVAQLRGDTFSLDCGSHRYSSDFDLLFDCAAQGAPPPTDGFDADASFVEFSISAITTPGVLFRCEIQ